jgi:hypothetical protein
MRFKDDTEIQRIVSAFETATITRENWKHAEHMIVGLYYLETLGYQLACNRMRGGILNLLLRAFNVDFLKEMPYHETITIFWLETLDRFRLTAAPDLELYEKVNRMLELFDKDYPLRYYSRDRLFSEEARRSYLAPDLQQHPEPLAVIR